MSIPNKIYLNALLISLPIYVVVLISWLILDYVQSGSIDGILNNSDGLYWALFALGPAILVAMPWSIAPMIGMVYGLIPMHGVFIALFLSLYVNGFIIMRRLSITGIWTIPKLVVVAFLFIPLVLAVLVISIAIGSRYL